MHACERCCCVFSLRRGLLHTTDVREGLDMARVRVRTTYRGKSTAQHRPTEGNTDMWRTQAWGDTFRTLFIQHFGV